MKEVRYSTKAKKDLKRYRNDLAKMQELFHVLQVLSTGGELDQCYRPHMLTGNYKTAWNAIYVERVGSHAELFGKKKGL